MLFNLKKSFFASASSRAIGTKELRSIYIKKKLMLSHLLSFGRAHESKILARKYNRVG